MNNESNPTIEVTVDAPVDVVREWFGDPMQLRQWFGWEAPGLDDEIGEIFGPNKVVVDAGSIHIGGHLFQFVADGDRTSVTVERRAPTDPDEAVAWDQFYDDVDEGWRTFLQQLRFALDLHRGDSRRTIYLNGEAVADPPLAARDLLGLGQVLVGPPGSAYRAEIGPGDVLSGEVWHESEHQLGVTVEDWGPGLLVVAQAPGTAPPALGASMTLTTYGLDDEQIATLADRWATWWGGHFAPAPE